MQHSSNDTLPNISISGVQGRLAAVVGIALSLIGGIASALALKVHLGAEVVGCKVGVLDCQAVLLSKYGQLFGLPLPVFTGPYYLVLALCLILYRFGQPN